MTVCLKKIFNVIKNNISSKNETEKVVLLQVKGRLDTNYCQAQVLKKICARFSHAPNIILLRGPTRTPIPYCKIYVVNFSSTIF